jgi:PBP1b-binding outer membrane lipoprotein LpoB
MKKQILMLLGLVAVLSSCSSYNYYAVSNKKLIAAYRTYAWLPESKSKASNIYDNDVAADRIVEAASTELENRGFKLNNKKPDVLIRYTAVVNKETRSYDEPVYYDAPGRYIPRVGLHRGRAFYYYAYRDPFPVYVGNEQRTVNVKQGSIMIDLIDRKTKKVIWRGWAEGELNNPEKAIAQIPKVIENIFKKLPA